MLMQGYFGSGILTENSASADNNYLKRLESKKLLSSVEKAGLLSKAEKAGLTLSRVRANANLNYLSCHKPATWDPASAHACKESIHVQQAFSNVFLYCLDLRH